VTTADDLLDLFDDDRALIGRSGHDPAILDERGATFAEPR
jgi:hypothetical protein